MDTIIRPQALAKRLGISVSTLYRRIKDPDFPPRVSIGRAVGFKESDVEEYIEKNTEIKGVHEVIN